MSDREVEEYNRGMLREHRLNPAPATTRDRNPDAISAVLDKTASTLAGLSAKLTAVLALARGAQPEPPGSRAGHVVEAGSIVTMANILQTMANDIVMQVDELQRIL